VGLWVDLEKEIQMNDINLITDFFMWFSIINISIIILFYILLYFAFDFFYMPFKKIYLGSKEEFNKLVVNIFFQYRMLTGFLAVFPYITLLIINN
jgi:hypothetical protein